MRIDGVHRYPGGPPPKPAVASGTSRMRDYPWDFTAVRYSVGFLVKVRPEDRSHRKEMDRRGRLRWLDTGAAIEYGLTWWDIVEAESFVLRERMIRDMERTIFSPSPWIDVREG